MGPVTLGYFINSKCCSTAVCSLCSSKTEEVVKDLSEAAMDLMRHDVDIRKLRRFSVMMAENEAIVSVLMGGH